MSPMFRALVLAAAAGTACSAPAPTCADGARNGTETDVDCGGACAPCLDGRACAQAADCVSGTCVDDACRAASCDDGLRNGAESGTDCGGPCPACPAGQACGGHADCASGACVDGTCAAPAGCRNGALDGDESGTDCGGSCGRCEAGAACRVPGDCASGRCVERACAPADACSNGRRDGDESDVDCGGSCAKCAEGRTCGADADCARDRCDRGVCRREPPGTCRNEAQDGDETDVDCGGSCGACPSGYRCGQALDCEGGFISLCQSGICGGPYTCMDDELNGHETDLDCGGGLCRGCPGGRQCALDRDCLSGACERGRCTAPPWTCDNGVRDGLETDADCGGGLCPECDDGFLCGMDADCASAYCDVVCGGSLVCSDGTQNGRETDVDCGGAGCPGCAAGQACDGDTDCLSASCTNDRCDRYAPSCGDGARDDLETDVDCGGPGCVPCAIGRGCAASRDCETRVCDGTCRANVATLQAGAASVSCASSGVVPVQSGVALRGLYVVSPRLELDAQHDGWFVEQSQQVWTGSSDPRFMGILLRADRSLGLALQYRDFVDVTADHVEIDCMSALEATSAAAVRPADPFGHDYPVPAVLLPSLLEDGGSAGAEPYEGTVVALRDVVVTDATGFDGPEAPGAPRWWFKAAGVLVANDFGLLDRPAAGAQLLSVQGVVVQRQGAYVLLPRVARDVAVRPAE